jgi:hypothetical protein
MFLYDCFPENLPEQVGLNNFGGKKRRRPDGQKDRQSGRKNLMHTSERQMRGRVPILLLVREDPKKGITQLEGDCCGEPPLGKKKTGVVVTSVLEITERTVSAISVSEDGLLL